MKMLFFDFRESERDYFNKHKLTDFEIEFIKEPLNENTELSDSQLSETDIISVFVTSNLTENVLKKFKNLRIISARSTGFNHIDIKYCKRKHIAVFNADGYGARSVAQFTLMLMIALVRNLKAAYLDIKTEKQDYSSYEGRNMESLRLGIIGCGTIGSAVAKLANALGMSVYVNSLDKRPDVECFAQYIPFDELLRSSDIISLHIPYSPELYHMIGREEVEKMKDGVYIVNTARGELIDIAALYEGVQNGKIKGAALDVFECEDLTVRGDGNPYIIKEYDKKCVASALVVKKLLGKENIILTPHIAYNTKESIDTILDVTFNNIKDYCKGMHTNQIY